MTEPRPEAPSGKPKTDAGVFQTGRSARTRRPIYRFGPFELDRDQNELRRSGLRIRVAPAPMELLILLIERRNFLVGRDEISARLWQNPEMVDVDQGINTAVRRVREVLRDNPSTPRFVETVVGKGYRFIAEVEEFVPETNVFVVDEPLPQIIDEETTPEYLPTPIATNEKTGAEIGNGSGLARKSPFKMWVIGATTLLIAAFLLAFVWPFKRFPLRHYSTEITEATANDSDLRVTAAAISGDGKWIAYADLSGVWLQLLQSGKTVSLNAPKGVRIDSIAWFSDQTRILASGFDSAANRSEIWTIFVTGGSPQLFRADARDGAPSPDGTRVAFTQNQQREIWVAGADGVGAHSLILDPSGKASLSLFWSGDGKRISYLRSLDRLRNGMYLSADSSTGKILASQTDIDFQSALCLADGRVFFLRDSTEGYGDRFSLWEVDTNRATGAFLSSPVHVASLERARAFGLSSSDDGSKMTVVLEKGDPHVYTAMVQQSNRELADIQRLTFDTRTDYPDSWLHDNQTLLFESNRRGILKLYEQRLGDQNARELSTGSDASMLGQVTPDGKWILFGSKSENADPGEFKLFRISTEGGTAEEVRAGETHFEFRCPLRGGSKCVLLNVDEQKSFTYYQLDPMTGKGKLLAKAPWTPHVLLDWTVSPDGTEAAIAVHDLTDPKIRVLRLGGDESDSEREIPVKGYGKLSGISWSADGTGWYVAADLVTGASLLFVSRQGEVNVLHESPTSTWGVPSPDGRRLAFVDQSVDSNVWIVKLASGL